MRKNGASENWIFRRIRATIFHFSRSNAFFIFFFVYLLISAVIINIRHKSMLNNLVFYHFVWSDTVSVSVLGSDSSVSGSPWYGVWSNVGWKNAPFIPCSTVDAHASNMNKMAVRTIYVWFGVRCFCSFYFLPNFSRPAASTRTHPMHLLLQFTHWHSSLALSLYTVGRRLWNGTFFFFFYLKLYSIRSQRAIHGFI